MNNNFYQKIYSNIQVKYDYYIYINEVVLISRIELLNK